MYLHLFHDLFISSMLLGMTVLSVVIDLALISGVSGITMDDVDVI